MYGCIAGHYIMTEFSQEEQEAVAANYVRKLSIVIRQFYSVNAADTTRTTDPAE